MGRVALGEFEHHVMLALQRLCGKAHGPPVVAELEQATGRAVSPASVFIALRRLEQRGLTRSRKHEPRPAVSQRRSEVGVRIALGASHRSVLGLIVYQGMRPVVIGLAIGIAGALWLSQAMSTLLFGMTAADVPTHVAVATLLAGAAALACYVPARAALRVDVTATLREE